MVFDKEFCEKNVVLDLYSGPNVDVKEEDDKETLVVDYCLSDTVGLNKIVDELRESLGYKRMYPKCEFDDDYIEDGWYNFYVIVEDKKGIKNAVILATVDSDEADDSRECYELELSNEEMANIYDRINIILLEKEFTTIGEIFEKFYKGVSA